MVGITQQSILGPNKYETASGVRQGVDATLTQTQIWFDNFECFKRRALDLHLAVAQQCQEEGKDISVMYTKSDLTRAFLTIGTDGLSMRHMGVQAITNAKKRQELERFKEFMLQMNTAGSDVYDLAQIATSDSMVTLRQVALESRRRADQIRQQEQQNQMQLNQQQIQADQQAKEREYQHELQLAQLKGNIDLQRERIRAAGYAADQQADTTSLDYLTKTAEQSIRQADVENRYQIEQQRLDDARAAKEQEAEFRRQELELKREEIRQRQRDNDTARYVAGINKN